MAPVKFHKIPAENDLTSQRLAFRMEQLCCQWTDFCEVLYWWILQYL